MILWVRGDPFPAGAINDLALRDLQELDRWLVRHGRSVSHWWELPGLADEFGALPDGFKDAHPERDLLLAVWVWATLRKAGFAHTFDEVLVVGPDEVWASDADDRAEVESLPRGFRAGNVSADATDMGEYDLEHEVYSRLLDVMHRFPAITPWNVWDLPLFVWRGVAAHVDAMRRKG